MIIDSHHHLWRYSPEEYDWMDDSMNVLKRDYLPEDLNPLLREAGVEATVVVQARQTIEETIWLLELADHYSFVKAVVGWMDLRSSKLPAELEIFSDKAKLVGLRHVIQDEPDPEFMLQKDFLAGISKLKDYNLSYDLLIFPHQLQSCIKMVGLFPEQKFVLNHMAKPPVRNKVLEPWKTGIQKLAEFPNVCCKISGIITEADWNSWRYEDLLPYLDVVTQAFGTKRLMVGSDWPVCRLAGEYSHVIQVAKSYFKNFSEPEKRSIFRDNVKDFYGF